MPVPSFLGPPPPSVLRRVIISFTQDKVQKIYIPLQFKWSILLMHNGSHITPSFVLNYPQ